MAARIFRQSNPQLLLRHNYCSNARLRIRLHTRTFFTNPLPQLSSATSSSDTQALTASRTLPHDALSLFNIIVDISAYPSFLPFCRNATVTHYSEKDPHLHKKWPARATLSVGYADAVTKFESSVYCVPPHSRSNGEIIGICEAVSGDTISSLRPEDLQHYTSLLQKSSPGSQTTSSISNGPLAHLRTTWTLKPHPHKLPSTSFAGIPEDKSEGLSNDSVKTDVHLSIEFRFRSMMLEMMSRAATPRVAEMMVEAFVGRVGEVLGK